MLDRTAVPQNEVIIVGVGASAGGLEAFQQFLTGLPDKHNMAIVLVQHLDPDHTSLMPELVSAKTASPVHSVTDEMTVEGGHIYLIPPGYEMEIEGYQLSLRKFKSPRGLRRPIDRFFKSLSAAHGDKAVAVILSGTGSDGAEGARELKGAGGLVFVQDPREAKYDGMPQSVLDQGGADAVLQAAEIIDVLRDYFNLRFTTDDALQDESDFLARIMRHVRFRTGHDFSEYKSGTILRRVTVRMSVLNISTHNDYLQYIAEHKEEADQLFRDLLINVTSFFRDPSLFESLDENAIRTLVEECEEQGDIRVWVAGCSTGEEAYSIGMLLLEEINRVKKACHLVVFGTDIDEQALRRARTGHYPNAIADDMPAELLDRYFTATNTGYEIGKDLRECVRFSKHSFVKDPPFSKIDLIACRNVLIYFKEPLQEMAAKVFHYALREDGFLFIGPSENPKSVSDLFDEVSSRARLFRRPPGPSKPLDLGSLTTISRNRSTSLSRSKAPVEDLTEIERTLVDHYTPAHIHVDRAGNVIFTSKSATRFLAVRGGRLSQDITSLIAPDLETTVRQLCRLDARVGSQAERDFQGEINGRLERLVLKSRRMGDGSLLLVIEDKLNLREDRPTNGGHGDQADTYVRELENELDDARQTVRTTVEELETSNEELKSSNEEMMSMNEELQSANEELTTINDELQQKVRELNEANLNLNNFIESTNTATVFLSENFSVNNFTPEAQDYFSFTRADMGRPLGDLSSVIDINAVLQLCRQSVEGNCELSEEFLADDGKTSLLAIVKPYSPDGKEQYGTVLTLQDVTELRNAVGQAEKLKRASEDARLEVEQIYKTSPLGMGLIDRDMKYVRLNEQLASINGVPVEKHIGATVRDIIPAVADQTEALIQQVFESGKPILNVRVEGSTLFEPDIQRVWDADWTPFFVGDAVTGVSVTVRDVTDLVTTTVTLQKLMRELEHRVKNMLANVTALINQARREAKHDKEVYEKLTRRIHGLAKTHALLTAEEWSAARIIDIIGPETADVYGQRRVELKGPDLRVNAQATLSLGMAMHEMATNAAKYGAFSTEDGMVSITWSRVNDSEGDRLIIKWVERGGPPVEEPGRTGFGSQLIETTLAQTLNGNVHMAWEPEGLTSVIELNYEQVTEPDE
ncbi:MAG: chemotaxis protein CheB [Pseudomonadota bacterium]